LASSSPANDLEPRRSGDPQIVVVVVAHVGSVLLGKVYGSVQSAHSSHGYRDVADEVSSEIWQALDLLAKNHPGDEGVWLALELRDRLKAHYERLKALQIPSAEDKQKSS
jgi:hypothetical protein